MGLVKVGCANYIVKCRPRLPYIVGKVHDRNYKDLGSVDFISRGLKSVPTTLLVTELVKCIGEDPECCILVYQLLSGVC